MAGKTALNKEMKHLNGAYFRTIRRKKLKYKYYGFLKVHEQFSVE